MRFREGGAHRLALLLVREALHGRLEEENAKDGEEDDEFEHYEPHQGLSPGHVPEPVPVQGSEKREYAGAPGHDGGKFSSKLLIIPEFPSGLAPELEEKFILDKHTCKYAENHYLCRLKYNLLWQRIRCWRRC